ncbi:CYTH domain-containing protein [Rhizobium sp. CG4]|jgi:CYTH domain-containing protein|uniref:CYTH domain-containing protein n=1 Tax=Rhizobium/Agrobacterium group TaxID=227290 RepID=UPI00203484B0|nr:CYTH domain-containing protein [Rhizobium sp. CG4]MCM2454611.1 CYTH domain-containing protein [Rhizobium sp. CG4]
MAKEIERKFLVSGDGWKTDVSSSMTFRQGYVVSTENRSVRVRIVNDEDATLTIKIGASSLVRDEYEYSIALGDAQEMIGTAIGNVIQKTRHLVEHNNFTWEVDVFEGVYGGLVVAEVELTSVDDSPDLPTWLGREVTGDKRYSNQYLATENLLGELPDVVSS